MANKKNLKIKIGGDMVRISELDLTAIEATKNVIVIQSSFNNIAYAVKNGAKKGLYIINRDTGAEIAMLADEVWKFADEMATVAEVFL